MSFPLKRTAAPTIEPVSLDDMKLHLRVDYDEDDSLISSMISVARERAEDYTSRCIFPQQWTFALNGFPNHGNHHRAPSRPGSEYGGIATAGGVSVWWGFHVQHITIPRSPLISIDSITYKDLSGVSQTLDPTTYEVDMISDPGHIRPLFGQLWPFALPDMNSVVITFTAGYSDPLQIPSRFAMGIKLDVTAMYQNRASYVISTASGGKAVDMPLSAERLYDDLIVNRIGYY